MAENQENAANTSISAEAIRAELEDLKDAVNKINVNDGGIAFEYPASPTSPKPVLRERQPSVQSPKRNIDDVLKAADERREKLMEAVRVAARTELEHVKNVVSKSKADEEALKHKATVDVEEKLKKAEENRTHIIEEVKETAERVKEREQAVKHTREDMEKTLVGEYRDKPVVSLDADKLATLDVEKLNDMLATEEKHKKALQLILDQSLFITAKSQCESDLAVIGDNCALLTRLIDEAMSEEIAKANISSSASSSGEEEGGDERSPAKRRGGCTVA